MTKEGGDLMLRDGYEPLNLFDVVSALRLALDPGLTQRDRVLDDDPLFQAVKAAWARRFPRPLIDGRPSTPVEVMLRMLVVKPLSGGSDEATARWGSDRLVWRQCCRVYAALVPDDTTLRRWAHLIPPATLPCWLDRVVVLVRSLQGTRGRKLRIEGTVVEPHLHHPTDRTLLDAGGRVLSRTVAQATQARHEATVLARRAMRDRPRRATRPMKRLMEAARPRGAPGEARLRTADQRLLPITPTMVTPAERVGTARIEQGTPLGRTIATPLPRGVPWGPQVTTQTPRRMLQGEAVPAPATVVRVCAPHPASIRQGKPGRPTACGRVLWREAVEGGLISRDAVLEGHPAEDAPRPPSLAPHRRVFHRPPRRLAGERGRHTTAHEQYATTPGVKPGVWPQPGAKSATRLAHEPPRWVRQGHPWRSGLEGRSRGLKRRPKRDRCRYHGPDGLERGDGWGVITHKLRVMAQATVH
jgi:transposase, IS5 family